MAQAVVRIFLARVSAAGARVRLLGTALSKASRSVGLTQCAHGSASRARARAGSANTGLLALWRRLERARVNSSSNNMRGALLALLSVALASVALARPITRITEKACPPCFWENTTTRFSIFRAAASGEERRAPAVEARSAPGPACAVSYRAYSRVAPPC